MNRRILTAVLILVSLSFIVSPCYAWDTFPIARIVDPIPQYICVGDAASFDGVGSAPAQTGSYDPDNGEPYGGGKGIATYGWWYGYGNWDYSSGGKPSHTYNTAGVYYVHLYVYDDDLGTRSQYWDTCMVYVVEVDKIKINYAGTSWDDVTGETIVVLKGTKYTFEAFPNPSSAIWPPNTPNWSGVASGTGETIDVTFNSTGTYTLTAKCGSVDTGKTVTIDVIVPAIDEVSFVSGSGATAYDIYDGTDRWRKARTGQTGENDPGCFRKANNSAVRVKFWHEKNLTYAIGVKVWGDVDLWDEDTTGGNYPGTSSAPTVVFSTSWPAPTSGHVIVSPSTIQDFVHDDSVDIRWEYKVPWGTNSWIYAGRSNNLDYYIVWDNHKTGAPKSGAGSFTDSDYTKTHIRDAIDWGEGVGGTDAEDLADEVCDSVHRSFVYAGPSYNVSNCWGIHDTSTGHCGHLAAEMAYVMRCLGVACFMSHANLVDVSGGLNDGGTGNGAGFCDTHEGIPVKKMGDTYWSSNHWQGCAYLETASPNRDTICWDPQHNEHEVYYWELGNDRDNPADAPGGRYGTLFNYRWRRAGTGGGTSQSLSGDDHTNCSGLRIVLEHNGN